MDKLKQIKNNLSYIKASIENGTDKEQAAILHLIVSETIEAAQKTDISFKVPYSSENHMNHMYTFFQYGQQAKAKLLTNLEELKREITRRNGNTKRSLAVVENLLTSDLCRRDVKNKVDKWVNTTSFPTKHQIIYTDHRGRNNQHE
jgi:hypothetical protein